jgi:hypothetical protein
MSAKSSPRQSWRQKYTSATKAHVKRLEKPFGGVPAGAVLFIPAPDVIESYLRALPAGSVQALPAMRTALAKAHGADASCPVATSIYLKVVAELALEDAAAGKPLTLIAPFWRVLPEATPLVDRLSCGSEFIRIQQALERTAAT